MWLFDRPLSRPLMLMHRHVFSEVAHCLCYFLCLLLASYHSVMLPILTEIHGNRTVALLYEIFKYHSCTIMAVLVEFVCAVLTRTRL